MMKPSLRSRSHSCSEGGASPSSVRRRTNVTTKTRILHLVSVLLMCSNIPQSLARRTRLTWVNGMGHHPEHMAAGGREISRFFGGEPVLQCYNPTCQTHDDDMVGLGLDLTQAGSQMMGRITEEVNSLVRHLREAIALVGPNGCVVHIAHSQGALITHLAAKQLTPLEMSQIEVLAFGGAAAIRKTPRTPFRRCVNYYSVNDPLLLVVPQAAQALRSGFVGDEEFCFLAPRAGDPIADHHLIGPTYAQALRWEGARFQHQYHGILYRTCRPLCLFFLAFLRALSARIYAITYSILYPILKGYFCFCQYAHDKLLLLSQLLSPLVVIFASWVQVMIVWLFPEKVAQQ